jgi:pimeloyl-ACP methyl ester carboxylesterase
MPGSPGPGAGQIVAVEAAPSAGAVERADALYQAGDAEGAFALLDRHLASAPEDYEARWKASRAAVSVGLLRPSEDEQNAWYRTGMAHGAEAARIRPDGVDGLYWLCANQGRLAIQLSPGASAAAALEVYDRARRLLALDSLHAGAHNALGKIGFEVMKLSALERLLARALVGNEALRRASWEDTERHQRLAVKLDPEMPLYRLDLGRTLLHTGRYDLAARELEAAIALPNRHPGDALYKEEAERALGFARRRRTPMSVKVSSGAVTLNVDVQGPENGAPVVLLHAFPLSSRMWDPQIAALRDRHRVVAPDYRGFGESDLGDGQYTIELFVDDLLEVLDALGLERVTACGLSMGGYVLLRALERAPERFRAVVLADTRSQADDDASKLGRAATLKSLKTNGLEAFAEQFSGKLLGPTTLARGAGLREDVAAMIRRNRVLAVGGALLALAARTDTTEALRRLAVPALILVGEEDAITPPAHSRAMSDAAPGAKLVQIAGAGHMSNIESPEAFNRALLGFLEEVDA